jgi:hypothetical protein
MTETTEKVQIVPSVFKAQVESGMKRAELAAHYSLPETNIAAILKQLKLTIKKTQTPKFVIVEETAPMVTSDSSNLPEWVSEEVTSETNI